MGIVVACVCVCVCLSVCVNMCNNSGPVQARITKFGQKKQKTFVKVSIVLWTEQLWFSRQNLTWNSKFAPLLACLHLNSPPIPARITKFGPEVQNTLVKILIDLVGYWPWFLYISTFKEWGIVFHHISVKVNTKYLSCLKRRHPAS